MIMVAVVIGIVVIDIEPLLLLPHLEQAALPEGSGPERQEEVGGEVIVMEVMVVAVAVGEGGHQQLHHRQLWCLFLILPLLLQ